MIACFDIGGSWIKGGLAHASDDVRPTATRPTPADDFEAFAASIAAMIEESGPDAAGVSISVPGIVDPVTGRLKCANIPCIDGRAVAGDLGDHLGRPVHVANDADCFVLTEATLGAGRGHAVVFGIILGTGVGGGIVVDGRLHQGAGGYAGEWGHGPVAATTAGDPPAAIPRFACGCGQTGCIDTIGGARGLERIHHVVTGKTLESTAILQAWHTGDGNAGHTLSCYLDLVAAPLAFAINTIGADIVPVGGGLANDDRLIGELDRAVRAKTLRPLDRPLVVPRRHPLEPGLAGAAILGLDRFA